MREYGYISSIDQRYIKVSRQAVLTVSLFGEEDVRELLIWRESNYRHSVRTQKVSYWNTSSLPPRIVWHQKRWGRQRKCFTMCSLICPKSCGTVAQSEDGTPVFCQRQAPPNTLALQAAEGRQLESIHQLMRMLQDQDIHYVYGDEKRGPIGRTFMTAVWRMRSWPIVRALLCL